MEKVPLEVQPAAPAAQVKAVSSEMRAGFCHNACHGGLAFDAPANASAGYVPPLVKLSVCWLLDGSLSGR